MSNATEFGCATGLLKCLLDSIAILGDYFFCFEDRWAEGDGEHNGIINAVLGMRKDQEVLRDIACLFHFPFNST